MDEMEILDLPDPDTTCTICFAEFLETEDLEIHTSQVHTAESLKLMKKCQFCTQSLSDLEAYALHIRDEHVESLKCCKYCSRVFTDVEMYRKHESKHFCRKKTECACSQCKKIFSNTSELEAHEITEHKDSSDGIVLHECFPLLSSLINIKFPRFLQSYGDDVVYVCVKCELTTPDVTHYIDHLRKSDCRSLVCDFCSSTYKDKKGLNRHFLYHTECYHGAEKYHKKCPECFKMFDFKTWIHHTKHCKVIKCNSCNIVFDSVQEMSRHHSVTHPNTITLTTCLYCHKDFVGKVSLEKHIKRAHEAHFHLYKYRCVYCNAFFKHPKKLFAHFYSTHRDFKPYTCKICNIKFKVRKKFTIHIKLDHKSIGYIEFDENYHVFFSDKKSENPFKPDVLPLEHPYPDKVKQAVAKSDAAQSMENEENLQTNEVIKSTNKVTFNIEDKTESQVNLVNVNSDFMSATETEGNFTEVETSKKDPNEGKIRKTRKRKRKLDHEIPDESSDDEPLVEIRRRVREIHKSRLRNATWNRKKIKIKREHKHMFICNVCDVNCYTYQNYNNHISLHNKNITSTCVKCSKEFNTKEELNEHYTTEHATSQLTETLKSILQRRKKVSGIVTPEISKSEKFQRTMKKVDMTPAQVRATVTNVGDKSISVQKFIENFTPETEAPRKDIKIQTSVSIKTVHGQIKEPSIKMTKCMLAPTEMWESKLSMPVRFKPSEEIYKATIRVVQTVRPINLAQNMSQPQEPFFREDNIDNLMDEEVNIPEVAQEVMLENSEELPKVITQKIILPKLPMEYNNISIAHLQPEAPFYKIVKVDDVLKSKAPKQTKKSDIKLPDGTKLVNVNPLAHLLGNRSIEKILERSKNKHYQSKSQDFETAIAKAMLKLKTPENFERKRRKKVEIEQ